jgi:alpha-ketoglutarate-dependent taurine dioxygenase
MDAVRQLDVRAVTSTSEVGAQIVQACLGARLVLVRTDPVLGCTREFWDSVLSGHAERATVDEEAETGRATGNIWSEVLFDPARRQTFRHSSSAQPLHTDGSYIAEPPPIVFLVCRQPAAAGGATLFLDGPDLIALLSRNDPAFTEQLTAEPVLFSKGGSEVESPIISSAGSYLRWNFYALSPQSTAKGRALAERFRSFLSEAKTRALIRSVRLCPGEAVFFHDSRVLHGRESFSANSAGDRCLWKGGLSI